MKQFANSLLIAAACVLVSYPAIQSTINVCAFPKHRMITHIEKDIKEHGNLTTDTGDSYRIDVTTEEIKMIQSVVMHEVGYCSKESQLAVTNVIINRVVSDLFPDDVYDILHAENQFKAIHNYYDNELPVTDDVKLSVIEALRGKDNTDGATYYYSIKYIKNTQTRDWFESLEFTVEIEGQRFFK